MTLYSHSSALPYWAEFPVAIPQPGQRWSSRINTCSAPKIDITIRLLKPCSLKHPRLQHSRNHEHHHRNSEATLFRTVSENTQGEQQMHHTLEWLRRKRQTRQAFMRTHVGSGMHHWVGTVHNAEWALPRLPILPDRAASAKPVLSGKRSGLLFRSLLERNPRTLWRPLGNTSCHRLENW